MLRTLWRSILAPLSLMLALVVVPAVVAAQGPIGAAKTWLGWKLVGAAVPVIVAALTVPTVQLFKALFAFIDNAPAWAKQALVGIVSAVFVALGSQLGVTFPMGADQVTSGTVAAILSAAIAMVLHNSKSLSGS